MHRLTRLLSRNQFLNYIKITNRINRAHLKEYESNNKLPGVNNGDRHSMHTSGEDDFGPNTAGSFNRNYDKRKQSNY